MPNVKSAKKRLRTNARDAERARKARVTLRTAIKKARADLEAGNTESESLKTALREIGKCASKGIIHKKKAARQESRLIKRSRQAPESA